MQCQTKSTKIRGVACRCEVVSLGDKVHKQEVVPLQQCIDKVRKYAPQCPLSHTHQMSVSQFKVDEYRQCTLEFFRWAIYRCIMCQLNWRKRQECEKKPQIYHKTITANQSMIQFLHSSTCMPYHHIIPGVLNMYNLHGML